MAWITKRDHDERADADHERHVERGGFEQAEAAFEFFGFGHFVATRCCKRTESIARKGGGAGGKVAKENCRSLDYDPRHRFAMEEKKRRGPPLGMTGVASCGEAVLLVARQGVRGR